MSCDGEKRIFPVLFITVTNQAAYLGFTVGLIGVADGGVGNPIIRISLHRGDNIIRSFIQPLFTSQAHIEGGPSLFSDIQIKSGNKSRNANKTGK